MSGSAEIMIDLSAFKGRDIQLCLHLLNLVEAEGVTDIRFVRQRLQVAIEQSLRPVAVVQKKRYRAIGPVKKCPVCGMRMGPVNTGGEKIKILGCRNCRYSEVVG